MRIARVLVPIVALPWLLACASPVQVAFDADESFERFRTWNWRSTDASRVDAPRDDAIALAASVSRLIADGLARRGFRRDVLAPDFTLTFHVSLQPRIEMVAVPRAPYLLSSHDASASYWIEGTDVEERRYEELQLSIDVGLASGRSVWRGAAKDRVEGGETPDLAAAIEELLRRLPPPSGPAPEAPAADQVARSEKRIDSPPRGT
ncbi:MAG: DUF4136 domain-containing protein [Myxococcota bacterium]